MVPSILAVTSQAPWPLDRGGHLRSFHLLKALASCFQVRLVAGVAPGAPREFGAFADARISLKPVYLNARHPVRELGRIATAAVRQEPYVCYRRHDHALMRDQVEAELARQPPDLIYLDHLDSLLFSGMSAAPQLIDLHNVYSTLVRRTADEQPAARQWYLRREARLLERIEARAVRQAQRLFAVSEDDAGHFRMLGASAVDVIPNGIDYAAYADLPTGDRSGSPLILYVGTLSWGPNASAARYLIRELLPAVRSRIPEARVRVIGRDPTPELLAMHGQENVEVIGNVADVMPHLREAHLLAVPLEAGGGSRLKILESFAAGLPVVSTAVGSEGLDVRTNEHLLIADLKNLPAAALTLLRDRPLANRLAHNARQLVVSQYGWDTIGRTACRAVMTLVGAEKSARPAAAAMSPTAHS